MNDQKNIKDSKEKFDENEIRESDFDTFFADLDNIEQEITTEAYELVVHALSLIEGHYFDDAIEVLRQAIGLYSQINKKAEIEALKQKISDIYILKEEHFRKTEIEPEGEILEEEDHKSELIANAHNLINKGKELLNIEKFEEALDTYDEAIVLFQKVGFNDEIENVNKLIEQCYNRKADFLRKSKELPSSKRIEEIKIQQELSEEELKQQRIKAFEEAKKREEEISNKAFEILGKASDFAKIHQYDQAINLYLRGATLFEEINWSNEVKKVKNTIEQLEKEKSKFEAEIELAKAQESQLFEQQKATELVEQVKIEAQIRTQIQAEKIAEIEKRKREEESFKKKITEMINDAEKIAREYEIEFKKTIKKGSLLENCIYPEVIAIYEKVKNMVAAKGWKDQVILYSNQIIHYRELLEKDENIRRIEVQKVEKQKDYEEIYKTKKEQKILDVEVEKIRKIEELRSQEREEEEFRSLIDSMVNKAEKLAREYDIDFKKAVKKGNLNFESKYPEIIEIYTQVKNLVLEKGFEREGALYSKQIQKYSDLFENEMKVRQIEAEKVKKQIEFEQMKKVSKEAEISVVEIQKVKDIQARKKIEKEEDIFEAEIDQLIDTAEKEAREYGLAIKRGEFERECPYTKMIEIYKNVREKVYARGWSEEAKIYTNQIILYQEKLEKDKKLRELEAEKVKRQQEYEESFKQPEITALRSEKLQEIKEKDAEGERLLAEAMNLINEAESEVKSYELSMKKDILIYQSPYDKAISNYEKARKLFKQIGWTEEAQRLINTINFYKEKKARDDKLRDLEHEKIEKAKLEEARVKYIPEHVPFAREQKIIELEKLKQDKSKGSEAILNFINKAERMAQEYEIKKKDGILNIASPYLEIINIYKEAKKGFEQIGWNEQAGQLVNSINHYTEKMDVDNRLRTLETQKLEHEKKEEEKIKKEAKLAREAEAELLKQKAQSLELKKKQAQMYEAKKEQAFNFMDLAKREMKQQNFEKAIRFYKDSEKIFAEINWPEGIRMVNESIKVIKKKQEALENEKKFLREQEEERRRVEIQLKEQITKAQDLKDLQIQKRREELLVIQQQQEHEKEVSEQAYRLLEDGTALKNMKKFEEAYEKYVMGRDLFEKIGWVHEVSRINNDLLFILKKEMKQTEKIKAIQKRKLEEEKELEVLLKEAEDKRKELEKIKKEEKRKQRELVIQERLDEANNIIKDLKYNEGILKLKKVIRKLTKIGQDKQIKQLNKQIEILKNASQIPLITVDNFEDDKNFDKYTSAYQALDRAQLSLSENQFMRAISELNEAKFNLKNTLSGKKFIPIIIEKVNTYKKELGIPLEKEEKIPPEKVQIEESLLKDKIAARRAERRKRIDELLKKK